ncbi:MAG TPA: glycosyltransferase [Lacipirellulaceae bacterium]|nr:glycosyltransferase [Lacipirellulaceae bacterium]
MSVIVIGRNEAQRIEKCLRSVFASLPKNDECEVIYVDSASEDNTVAIASHFPIRILQLRKSWKLSPSAGRYIGYQHAGGKYLLFVDGDSLLFKRWLKKACAFLDHHPACGGVGGIMHQAYLSPEGKCVAVAKNYFSQRLTEPVRAAVSLSGIAMYRREAMEKAGTFNPFLTTGEECELALRIQSAGYSLARIYEPMCVTYSSPRETVREIMRRSRSRLYDYGTTLRYCLKNGSGMRFSIEQMSFVYVFLAFVIVALCAVVTAAITHTLWLLAIVLPCALLLVAVRVRNLRQLGISLLKRTMVTYCTFLSFCKACPVPVESYPTDAVIVK